MWPPPAATSFVPSAEEVTEAHTMLGALLVTQEPPAFVEMQIGLGVPPPLAATSMLASAEEATDVQYNVGAAIGDQVTPAFVLV